MRKNKARYFAAAVVALAAAGWWLTRPITIDAGDLPAHTANLANGEQVFWAGGCATCHATPEDGERARGEARLILGGGLELPSPYGVFRVPNISPDADTGIGAWTDVDFVNAMLRGVSPDGAHYYPSFPYASYTRMTIRDVLDLKAYLDTLSPLANDVADHELGFPWSIRRGIGVWKRRYLDDAPVMADVSSERIERGRYLVEGVGHCGECHTPRDGLGGLLTDQWLAGAPSLEGEGSVPDITPSGRGVSGWSTNDFAYYFESGFTPDFDSVGGSMVAVQENLSQLPRADLEAIAEYLLALAPAHTDTSN